MATIKAIEGRSVHQIQSGQVIVDLCSVVKELVENSLDAGATNIEVRFKNQGLDSIEVQDNGDSITPTNYETVALKHYTSKLTSYSDLSTLQTFGFRGEALSSLCALSHFTIIACLASDAPKGTRLEFEVSGRLKATSVVAAQKGTTVIIENLFNNLPVRRRELERNIKREWNRVVTLLGQYACIQTGVKISVTQQQPKGKKITIFSTKGNSSTRENIVNVFGAKTIATLLPLDLILELEPTFTGIGQRRNMEDDETKRVYVVGFVSRPAFGEGRQTPDKQMFFVNSRPCVLPQVGKAINEVYKSYNNSQSPFIFVNLKLDTHNYDVNVSPDKRTILLHDQTRLLEHLKDSLVQLFESQEYTLPVSQIPTPTLPSYKQITIDHSHSSPLGQIERDNISEEERHLRSTAASQQASRESIKEDQEALTLIGNWIGRNTRAREKQEEKSPNSAEGITGGPAKEKLKLATKLLKEKKPVEGEFGAYEDDLDDSMEPLSSMEGSQHAVEALNSQLDKAITQGSSPIPELPIPSLRSSPRQLDTKVNINGTTSSRVRKQPVTATTITIGDQTTTNAIGSHPAKRIRVQSTAQATFDSSLRPTFGNRLSQRFAAPVNGETADSVESEPQSEPASSLDSEEIDPDSTQNSDDYRDKGTPVEESDLSDINKNSLASSENEADEDYIDETEKKAQEDAKVEKMIRAVEEEAARPSDDNLKRAHMLLKGSAKKKDATVHLIRTLNTSVARIDTKIQLLTKAFEICKSSNRQIEGNDNDLDSTNPEEKLSLTITKSDFSEMKIIGQFNLGFILASRSCDGNPSSAARTSDDLFIIDQHASDEKYNFERLQATTIVQSQRLVQPKTLDLTALEEEVVKENVAALTTNGFIVTVDESGNSPVGQRCKLVSLPLSRETTFSLSDLEELISLLSDHPTGSIIPPPRPSKVRKMFAMRACRSSIMIGRTLTKKQMEKVVNHMGELDKPWNCPHGRPTMRHLCGLNVWDEVGWKEGDEMDIRQEEERLETDWAGYVRQMRHD